MIRDGGPCNVVKFGKSVGEESGEDGAVRFVLIEVSECGVFDVDGVVIATVRGLVTEEEVGNGIRAVGEGRGDDDFSLIVGVIAVLAKASEKVA